jgi:4,5-DOPA dioxygenase extradiol
MDRLPVLFVGHGSPYNIFTKNAFTTSLQNFSKEFFHQYHPKAIVLISAHWTTKGTFITADTNLKMIYDYYGFPEKFYEYTYPAHGSPEISSKISNFLPEIIGTTLDWGIDHAATIVLQHILPSGDLPIIELSLDIKKPLQYHYELGKRLAPLRDQGIYFIGSGNLIHTFREMSPNMDASPFEWALRLDSIQKTAINSEDMDILLDKSKASANKRGFQTLEHYIPLLYVLGMKNSNEKIKYIYEGFQHGSISHRSLLITSSNE